MKYGKNQRMGMLRSVSNLKKKKKRKRKRKKKEKKKEEKTQTTIF
jgi:hypothetical protein